MPVATADMFLPAAGRFDLHATVASYGYHELAPARWQTGRHPRFERIERLADGGVYLVRVRQVAGGVVLRAVGPDADQIEALAPLAARTRRVLRLDDDLTPFHRLCRGDPTLRPIARLGLGRLLRGSSLFEDVVKAIAWTNTTWPAAVQMVARLGALGSSWGGDRRRRAFPTPEQIVRAGEHRLRAQARLGYRADYIVHLAREVVEGLRDLDEFDERAATMPAAEFDRTLREIRGIGPSTVGWLGLMLGRNDAPAIDRATLRWAQAWLRHDTTADAVAAHARRWAPWGGLALWFLQWTAGDHPALDALRRHQALRRGRGTRRA